MRALTHIFDGSEALADRVALDLSHAVEAAVLGGRRFSLALSGGSTPRVLYTRLAHEPWLSRVKWDAVDVFWGDERCVPPDHVDSNYRMTRETLLAHAPLGSDHIHRVRGEDDPAQEAARYEELIRRVVPAGADGVPRFDWILLGMGDDGHTASLFPGQTLSPSGPLCGVARHPINGTLRVSFTHQLINAAAHVAFLVTGAAKAALVADIIARAPGWDRYPAAHVQPRSGAVDWYLDRAAGSRLPPV